MDNMMRCRNNNFTLSVVFFLFFCGSRALGLGEDTSPPEIVDINESVILQVNDNFSLLCLGDKPLKWTTPSVEESTVTNDSTTFSTEDALETRGRRFGLRLMINQMSYHYVGFYNCSYANQNDMESSVYLYVNDSDHLMVDDSKDHKIQIVTQYEATTLPCRPTSPDVKVTLNTFDGERIPSRDNYYETNTIFNPREGFFTNDTREAGWKDLSCHFSRGDKNQTLLISLSVDPPLEHLDSPLVIEKSGGHVVVGEPLTVVCKLTRIPHDNIKFVWNTPRGQFEGQPKSATITISSISNIAPFNTLVQDLTIHQTNIQDKGNYSCTVSDLQGHSSSTTIYVHVFDKNEHLPISLTEENGKYKLPFTAGNGNAQWRIDVKGHPAPKLLWRDNKGRPITMQQSMKYETESLSNQTFATLKIKNVNIDDFGNFTLEAKNDFDKARLNLFLEVSDVPHPKLHGNQYHIVNTEVALNCNVVGYPEPKISWLFKPCAKEENCQFEWQKADSVAPNGYTHTTSILKLNATTNGHVICIANNSLGSAQDGMDFFITDVKNGRGIFDLPDSIVLENDNNTALVAVGDTFTATCGSSLKNYDKPQWYFNGKPVETNNNTYINNGFTSYSNRSTITISNVGNSHEGDYTCMIPKTYGTIPKGPVNLTLRVEVLDPSLPVITNSNMKSEFIKMDYPAPLNLFCEFNGLPHPNISWYKDEEPLLYSERVTINERGDMVTFSETDPDMDEGTYKCKVENGLGSSEYQTTLEFNNKKTDPTLYLALTGGLLLIVLALIVFVVWRLRKERMIRRHLLEQFTKGNIDALNPELGVNDQAQLLPYDKKYEFPEENLKIGKLLGSGAFGCVFKAEAKNLVDTEPITTVAVKTINKTADENGFYFKALESELKIMIHMGKHLNIVNLLGACTAKVDKSELLIIVEYCRFGNLQNYLIRHRNQFIDQIDPKTRQMDFNIGADILERSYSVSSGASSPLLKYGNSPFSNSGAPSINTQDYKASTYTGDSANTEMTQVEDPQMLSNNSIQPGWRSNYRGDYNGQVSPICTKDLLIWAFQVARGMEYLASRKILHSDLAARNILLAENNIVKICDFGLAKSMQQSEIYKKTTNNPMPIKWMALESLEDKDFSTKSDVWSFGIVLWEFFSLGRTPYPGIEAERLYDHLKSGHRMECPDYAPCQTYKIMTDCWHAYSEKRPSFSELVERLGSLLNDTLKRYYIDLNDPYLAMNTRRFQDGSTDYLAMLSPPDGHPTIPHTPHYMNDDVSVQRSSVPEDSEGYLSMSPNIFSPRIENHQRVFDFNSMNNRKNLTSVEGQPHETLPMLQMINETSCETPTNVTPTTPNSFSNPSYHIPPNISEKSNVVPPIGTKDNYITMPQYKNIVSQKDLINDEGKHVAKDKVVLVDEPEKVRYINDFITPSIQV